MYYTPALIWLASATKAAATAATIAPASVSASESAATQVLRFRAALDVGSGATKCQMVQLLDNADEPLEVTVLQVVTSLVCEVVVSTLVYLVVSHCSFYLLLMFSYSHSY